MMLLSYTVIMAIRLTNAVREDSSIKTDLDIITLRSDLLPVLNNEAGDAKKLSHSLTSVDAEKIKVAANNKRSSEIKIYR